MAVPWGRGASEYRPGLFTKQYSEKHGEAYCADIYCALSQEIEHHQQGEDSDRGKDLQEIKLQFALAVSPLASHT